MMASKKMVPLPRRLVPKHHTCGDASWRLPGRELVLGSPPQMDIPQQGVYPIDVAETTMCSRMPI